MSPFLTASATSSRVQATSPHWKRRWRRRVKGRTHCTEGIPSALSASIFWSFTAFFSVTLPIILPGVIAGWMLAFTLSLDDLVIASFTTGPEATTLPMKIYSQVRLGVTPEINAVCTILVGLVTVIVITASIVTKRQEVLKERDMRLAEAQA